MGMNGESKLKNPMPMFFFHFLKEVKKDRWRRGWDLNPRVREEHQISGVMMMANVSSDLESGALPG